MKISTILKHHLDATTSNSVADNLGDGYLLQNNPIYKLIRRHTLDLGFSFTNTPDSDYLTFPMGQLEVILQKKQIPYLDNVHPLQKINTQTKSNIEWKHVIDNLKPNYLFHESSHAVARSLRPIKINSLNETITITLLEESFANTCEFLALAYAQESIHKCYLEMNSFCTLFEARSALNKLMQTHGLQNIFKFMILCYLHSNFLFEKLTDKNLNTLLDLCSLKSNIDLKSFKNLAYYAFELNPNFRYTTAEMYLQMNGIYDPVEQVLNFDFVQTFKSSTILQKYMLDLNSLFSS